MKKKKKKAPSRDELARLVHKTAGEAINLIFKSAMIDTLTPRDHWVLVGRVISLMFSHHFVVAYGRAQDSLAQASHVNEAKEGK